jgi:hypothetical protein
MGRRRPIWPAESRCAAFRGLQWTYTSHITLGTRAVGVDIVGGVRKDLVFGVLAGFAFIWLTFFASPGTIIVATLVAAVVVLIWFSTVDPDRLRDVQGRPHFLLFGLTALGGALVVTSAVFISTPTVFLVGLVVVTAALVGIVRAIRAAMYT